MKMCYKKLQIMSRRKTYYNVIKNIESLYSYNNEKQFCDVCYGHKIVYCSFCIIQENTYFNTEKLCKICYGNKTRVCYECNGTGKK